MHIYTCSSTCDITFVLLFGNISQTNHTQGSHGNIAGKGGRARDDPIGTGQYTDNKNE